MRYRPTNQPTDTASYRGALAHLKRRILSSSCLLVRQALEGAIKLIVKKFPIMEIKSHSKELSPVNNIKADVIKALSLYYYTFVDLLDFKVRRDRLHVKWVL